MKRLSVPHLELLECLLLSQLTKEVVLVVSSRIYVDEIFPWTDSDVAVCWVKGKEICCKTKVGNWVVAIKKVVNRDRWGHIKEKTEFDQLRNNTGYDSYVNWA